MVEEGPHICGLILCFKSSGYVALLFTYPPWIVLGAWRAYLLLFSHSVVSHSS